MGFSSSEPVSTPPKRVLKGRAARVALPVEEIESVRKDVRKQNEYELIGTETRSVLFLGKTRSGKSTAVSVIKDPCFEPVEFTIFSETTDAKFQSFAIQNKQAAKTGDDFSVVQKYTLHVIDTPGLFEVKSIKDKEKGIEARTDEEIMRTIAKCLENEIVKLNCVVMFASIDSGVTNDDVKAITIFAKLFGRGNRPPPTEEDLKNNLGPMRMALCITRADKRDETWRNKIKSELMDDQRLAPIIKQNNIEILFMGCVEPKSYYNADDLFQGYGDVYDFRESLLKFIFESKLQQKLLELDIMVQKQEQISETIKILTEGFKYFKTVTDWGLSLVRDRMATHKENARLLAQDGTTYMNVSSLAPKFAALFESAKNFYNTESIQLAIRDELVWPLEVAHSAS